MYFFRLMSSYLLCYFSNIPVFSVAYNCVKNIIIITLLCPFEFKTLMHGNEDLSYEDNCHVFDVHKFFKDI